jgi:predicted regulator of Ras-like GTPase activity (Roadblock/LC7/MglB family)
MDWFDRLGRNQHIDRAFLLDDRGRIQRTTQELPGDSDLAASMLQSAEVLAQALADELGCGEARMLQISTEKTHILLFPLANSTHYLVVLVARTAPMMLIMVELERVLDQIDYTELARNEERIGSTDDTPVLDAQELIEAVREWLRSRPST